jgi:hypothetical protein|tara:strand:- start:1586 stop:1786 length:201 start_codon:yes stop_codon:yes gene_type:complete
MLIKMIILFSKGKIMSQYINQFDYKPQEEVSDIQKIVAYLKSIRSLLIYAVILLFLNAFLILIFNY